MFLTAFFLPFFTRKKKFSLRPTAVIRITARTTSRELWVEDLIICFSYSASLSRISLSRSQSLLTAKTEINSSTNTTQYMPRHGLPIPLDDLFIPPDPGTSYLLLVFRLAITWALGKSFLGIKPKRPLKSLLIVSENNRGDLAEGNGLPVR